MKLHFPNNDFVGDGDRCVECGGTFEEHESITVSGVFTEAELQDPVHPYHEQYLRLIASDK